MTCVLRSVLSAAALIVFSGEAAAQDRAWSHEAYAGVVSDYRYRGLSLSGNDPALQAGVTATHLSGLYSSVDLSSIEEYGIGDDGDGAETELTFTSGWTGSVNGIDLDVGLSWFAYPDGTNVSYFEVPIELERTVGNATWRTGFAYAPEQRAVNNEDNRYMWGGLEYAPSEWPISLAGTIGYEDGAYAPGGKVDWTIGLEAPAGPVSLGLQYIDSDADSGQLILSAFVTF